MTLNTLAQEAVKGEDSTRQFKSDIRNPILVSFIAKGLLPYHGLGSGIKRALEQRGEIDFCDDREGCQFTVTIKRKPVEDFRIMDESSGKTDQQIPEILSGYPEMTIPELAETLEITPRGIEKQIAKLKESGLLRRIGPAKGGRWEVLEESRPLA